MPIYEYRCKECQRVSEVFIRSAEGGAIRCPHCGSESLDRLVTASYLIRTDASASGTTCCGRDSRCDTPPCSTDDVCHRK